MKDTAISCESKGTIESYPARLGVLIFTASSQLCYRNRRAIELCKQITQYESTKTVSDILPLAVTNLADEIHRLLQIKTESKDWEQFQIRCVAGNPNHPVLLCGFGVAEADMAQPRIVIVMQVDSSAFWHRRALDRSRETFQLTWSEANILQHLLKGWTNKEIANALRVSEQTVKEHIKHLAAKTGSTTRTGVVMQAVLFGMHPETSEFPSESFGVGGRPSQMGIHPAIAQSACQ